MGVKISGIMCLPLKKDAALMFLISEALTNTRIEELYIHVYSVCVCVCTNLCEYNLIQSPEYFFQEN